MAGSLNMAQIIGHLGKDPEIRTSEHGKVASFSIATSERWTDKATGEKKEQTEWHRITVFNEHIIDGVLEKFVKKGAKVYIQGQIKTRKWQDQQGQDRYTTEIVIGRFNGQLCLLDKLDGHGSGADRSLKQARPESYGQTRTRDDAKRDYQAPPGGASPPARGIDDQIPF